MNTSQPAKADASLPLDSLTAGEAALDRAREVAQRIAERVKKLTDAAANETSDHASLSENPTEEQGPI